MSSVQIIYTFRSYKLVATLFDFNALTSLHGRIVKAEDMALVLASIDAILHWEAAKLLPGIFTNIYY